jgi:single-strand DNA-binding protein
MRTLNKAILIGNLGADPEVRATSQGQRVAHLSLATERRWTDAEGEVQKRTEWHRVIAWGRLSEIAEQYLTRGERVYVEGEIRYRTYEDAEGTTRHVTEITARELIMLGRRDAPAPEEATEDEAPPEPEPEPVGRGRSRSRRRESVPPTRPEDDDDLPF